MANDAMTLVMGLALVGLVVILFFELKGTQRKIDEMQGDLDHRLRAGLSEVAAPLSRIPHMEQRLDEVEREVAVLVPSQVGLGERPGPPQTPD